MVCGGEWLANFLHFGRADFAVRGSYHPEMTDRRVAPLVHWMARLAAVVGFVVVLYAAFRTGWTRISTDFPNYYTAAVAVRHHDPLPNIYDWTWFARLMNYSGIENQLGGYVPQSPATMLPIVPVAGFPPLTAKRIWLLVNLILLLAVIGILARMTGVRWEYLTVLLLCGYRSLMTNFVYGQYYIFLLFLITLTLDSFARNRDRLSGLVCGATFALKLYTGPLLVYFAVKRAWASVLGMMAGAACVSGIALLLFGWSGIEFYLTHVLPRTLEGNSVDPYNSLTATANMMLHKALLRDAELNPHPVFEAPWLFFFLRTAMQLGLVVFASLGIVSKAGADRGRDLAWFLILLVVISTSAATHTYILLLAPVAVLLRGASLPKTLYLFASYSIMNLFSPPALFLKVWSLLLLFFVVGYDYLRAIELRWAMAALAAVGLISAMDAQRRMKDYKAEPARRYQEIAIEPGQLFSGYPVVTRCGIFFQGMTDGRAGRAGYVLRWLHDGRLDTFDFGGNELHPAADGDGCGIVFEHVAHGGSTFLRLDPLTSHTEAAAASADPKPADGVVSPNGKWRVRVRETATSQQLWLEDTASGDAKELAGGSCNNHSPAWELDSSAVIFASDCGRAYGLPALYRAPVN
jgi:Glycosyltransferase family 87